MLRHITRICVRYAERYVPDPFLYATILTFLVVLAALAWTASGPFEVLDAWYGGIWNILAFAMQMALVLATGVALADAPAVKRLLRKLAGLPRTQVEAAIAIFLTAAVGSWLNWGFGLVIGALLAREIGKRLRAADFAFLVVAAYMGFMVWASGPSSSIALASATPGNALNLIEKVTGRTAGFDQTIFTWYNLVPVVLLLIVIPVALAFMAPDAKDMKPVDPGALRDEPVAQPASPALTFAGALEQSRLVTWLLVAMGIAYAVHGVIVHKALLDINGFVFLTLLLGLALHGTPIAYVRAFNDAAKVVGPILLQFPLYGGIMGIMVGTGLAAEIAQSFVAFSTHRSLPFWSFISSNIITLFIPSGGGHWAVQGPFMIPAAVRLNVDPAITAMATAMGEQVANMIQPFWALPILALARLGIKDIMGYCAVALIIGLVVYGGALLAFA